MPRGDNYSVWAEYSSGTTLGDQKPTPDMVAAIDFAVFYDMSKSDIQFELLPFTCTTGNCTWPHVQSLGVCSECADVSDLITTSGDHWIVSNGLELEMKFGIIASAGYTTYPDAAKLPNIGPLILKFVAMVHEPSSSDPPFGIDCALYWCIYEWTDTAMVNYTNVTSSQSSIWTDVNAPQTFYHQQDDIVLTPPTCLNDDRVSHSDTSPCVKTIGAYSQTALQNYLVDSFTGHATRNSTTGGWNIDNQFIQVLLTTAAETTDLLGSYTQIISNLATEMTFNIRQQTMDGVNLDYAVGSTSLWVSKFRIRWGYMIIPTLLVVLSAIFLVLVIIRSVGHEKWKSSSLPLLFHGLKMAPGALPERLMDMKEVVSSTTVHLEKTGDVSQFV